MSDSITIQVEQSKSTSNYGVYDAPEEGDNADAIVGTYIAETAAEQLGEYAALTVRADTDDAGLTLTPDKETASFGVFSDENNAVEATYVSHEVLAEISGQDSDSDSYSVPDSIGMDANPSDEDSFQQSANDTEAREQAAAALVGSSEQSEESKEESTTSTENAAESLVDGADEDADSSDEDEDEVEIADDEIGL